MTFYHAARLFFVASLVLSSLAHGMNEESGLSRKPSYWHKRKTDLSTEPVREEPADPAPKRSLSRKLSQTISMWRKPKSETEKSSPAKTKMTVSEIVNSSQWAYNYFDDDFVQSIIDSKSRYVLVASGFSESSLGKMNRNNQQKQKRAFALSMSQMMKIEQRGGHGKLIYLSTAPINNAYQEYLYRTFNQDRFRSLTDDAIHARYRTFSNAFISTVVFDPRERDKNAEDPTKYMSENQNAYRRIKMQNQIIPLIHDRIITNTFVGFTAHFTGPYLEKMAYQFGLPYLVNPAEQGHWIKKSKSRQSFRDAGVRHARGTYEPAFSVDALVNDIYALLQEIPGNKIIMKLDESAAGYGNRVFRFDDITDDMSEDAAKKLIRSRFDNKEDFPDNFIARIEEKIGGAIIEEFLDCKNYASPASIFMINGYRNVTVHYTYDQLLGGKDNMVFQGSIGPVGMPGNEEGDFRSMSYEVGMYLSEQGVRGNVGTDFVLCDDDTGTKRIAYAIENNVRMTGTSYPFYTMRSFLGEEMMKTKYMKSFDDVKIPEITLKDFRSIVIKDFYSAFMKSSELTVNLETGVGCLVHNDTFSLGKIGIACVGDSNDEVTRLYDDFAKAINDYLNDHEMVKLHKLYQ